MAADDDRYDELPFLVCHVTLVTPDGEDAMMVETASGELESMLYGTLVTTPVEMSDLDGEARRYLVFPDISVKQTGEYRIKASLYRITGYVVDSSCAVHREQGVADDHRGSPLAQVESDVFEVVEWQQFIGPRTFFSVTV